MKLEGENMRRVRETVVIAVLSVPFLIGIWQIVSAEEWQPYQFKGDERFEYRIIWEEDEERTEAIYVMDIRGTGEEDEEGEEIFEVSYTTKGRLSEHELGEQAAFGLWGVYGISLPMLFLNPMYGVFFGQMDLKVGEKMSLFGMGFIEVTGEAEVGGREGFVCQLFQEDELTTEWTIDPDLAMPIRSKLYEGESIQYQIELIQYTEY
jgi:hypothetical protein